MNWDHIEVKWAAMARRVRADLPETAAVKPEEGAPTIPPDQVAKPLRLVIIRAFRRSSNCWVGLPMSKPCSSAV